MGASNFYINMSGVWLDKRPSLGLPLVYRTKPPWTSWMFTDFRGFTDSPHPHKQENRGLDQIQATSFFPWWLLLFFRQQFWGKERFVKKIRKSGKILRNYKPDMYRNQPAYLISVGIMILFFYFSFDWNYVECPSHMKSAFQSYDSGYYGDRKMSRCNICSSSRAASFWNSLPGACFPSSYDLSCFKRNY